MGHSGINFTTLAVLAGIAALAWMWWVSTSRVRQERGGA